MSRGPGVLAGISGGLLSVGCLWDKGVSAKCFTLSAKLDQPASRGCTNWLRGPRMQAGVLGGQEGRPLKFWQCRAAGGPL